MEEVDFWEVEFRVDVLVQCAVLRPKESVPEEEKGNIKHNELSLLLSKH